MTENDLMLQLPGPLVDGGWLASHLHEVHVADVRWYLDGRSGRSAYEAGHVPTSVWVDLDLDLAGPPSPTAGRHPLPDPDAFALSLGRLGISEDRPVVAYDDASGSIAARLWWMLGAIGQPAAVLDGGFLVWTGPVETGSGRSTPVVRSMRPWPQDLVVDTSEVAAAVHDPDVVLLDARSPDRYRGIHEPVDSRAGHIPGAHNLPWTANVAEDGTFLPAHRLRQRYEEKGVSSARRVIASCGSGVTACHDLLALEVAGFPEGTLYPGSWSAWSATPGLDVAAGSDSGT
jgi:thiosulfate/3-mercaptopyruvate sulfurtransferase